MSFSSSSLLFRGLAIKSFKNCNVFVHLCSLFPRLTFNCVEYIFFYHQKHIFSFNIWSHINFLMIISLGLFFTGFFVPVSTLSKQLLYFFGDSFFWSWVCDSFKFLQFFSIIVGVGICFFSYCNELIFHKIFFGLSFQIHWEQCFCCIK